MFPVVDELQEPLKMSYFGSVLQKHEAAESTCLGERMVPTQRGWFRFLSSDNLPTRTVRIHGWRPEPIA
jgi:hypothetical protein